MWKKIATNKHAKIATLLVAIGGLVGYQAYASNQTQLNQAINQGVLAIDIVDGSGNTVASPSVNFGALTFSFGTQDSTGTLGTASETVRVYNPTSTETWTASIAGSAPTTNWSNGTDHYDFNDANGYTDGADADSYGGQLTVNPAAGSLAGVGGCATSNVSLGTNSAFNEGSTDSITVASAASGASAFCRWDITGVGLSQNIPAGQATGSYSADLVLSIL
jgi:hypothetical protein